MYFFYEQKNIKFMILILVQNVPERKNTCLRNISKIQIFAK